MAVINSTNTHSLLPYRWPKKSSEKNPKKVNSLIYKDYTLVHYEDGTKSYVSPEEKLQLLLDGKIKEDVERGTKTPKEPESDDSDSGYEVPIRREGRPKSCEDLDRPIRPEMKRNSSFPFSDSEAPGDGGRINLPPYIVPVETSLTFPMTKRKKKDKKRKEVEKGSEKLLRNLDDTVIDFPSDFRATDDEEEAERKKARPSTGFWGRIGKREDGESQQQQKPPKNRFTVPWTKHKEKSEPEDEEEEEEGRLTSLDKPEVPLGVDPKPSYSLKFPRFSWTKGKKEKMESSEELEEEKKKNLEPEWHSDDKKDVDEEEEEKEKPEMAPADANKAKHFAFKMPKMSLNIGRKDKAGEDPEKESERGKKRNFDDGEDEEEEETPEPVPSGVDKPKHFALKMPKLSMSRSRKDKTEEEPEEEKEGDFHDKEEEEEEKPDAVPASADKSKRFSFKKPKLSLNRSRKDKIEEEPEKGKEDFHDEEEQKEEKPEPVPSGSDKPKRFSLKMPKLSFNKSGKEKREGPEEPEEERSIRTLDSKYSEDELEERPEVKEELMKRNILEAEPGLEKPQEIFPIEEEQKSHGFPRPPSEVPKTKKWRNKGKIDPNPLRKMFGKRGAKKERDPSPAELPAGAQAATEAQPEGEDQSAGPEDPEPGPGVHGAKPSEDEGEEEGEARDGEVESGHLDDGSDTESADHGTHKSSMATLTSGKRSGSLIGGVLGFFKTGKTDKAMVDIADNGAVKTNLHSVEATPEKAPPEEPPVEGSKPDGIVYAELDMARFPGNVMRREDEKTEYAEIIYPGTKMSPERAMEELRKSRENLSSSRENLTEVDEAFSTMTTAEGKKEAAV